MKVLVTGDMGFIGTNLSAQLRERGYELTNPWRTFKAEADADKSLDVRRSKDVKSAVRLSDVVIHLAARKGSWFCDADTRDTVDTNLLGALTVQRACALLRRPLIHFGTTAYYDSSQQEDEDSWMAGGDGEPQPYSEDAPIFPRTIYGHTKWIAERMLPEWGDLRYLVIRPVYGYGNIGKYAASRSESWPDIILNAMNTGRLDPIQADMGGDFIKDYTHISDIVTATTQLLDIFSTSHELDGETVQVGAGGNYPFREIVNAFAPSFEVLYDPTRDYKGHQPHDYAKIRSILPGWRPTIDVLEYAKSRGAIAL